MNTSGWNDSKGVTKAMKLLKNFLHQYLELPQKSPKIVCLGGGTGLPNLLAGLKFYSTNLTAIVTMSDEGGSSGRLRRILGVPPVGDIRNCLVALSTSEEILSKLLNYRFAGNRYGADAELGGHSLGNLILAALADITGNFNKGLTELAQILAIQGKVLPSTEANARIWAVTSDGKRVFGEENIDLGKYDGKREIKRLGLIPSNAPGFPPAVAALKAADMICAGPGDLYTSIMPNLLISDIFKAISSSRAAKVFIVNIANKPFETPKYSASDYLTAVKNHCGKNVFSHVIVNTNPAAKIPAKLKYTYVAVDFKKLRQEFGVKIIADNFQDKENLLHHDGTKLAKAVISLLS